MCKCVDKKKTCSPSDSNGPSQVSTYHFKPSANPLNHAKLLAYSNSLGHPDLISLENASSSTIRNTRLKTDPRCNP